MNQVTISTVAVCFFRVYKHLAVGTILALLSVRTTTGLFHVGGWSQCLLTIKHLVDVYEMFVLLLSTDKEAMFSKHWLFVNIPRRSDEYVDTIIIPLIFSKHVLFAARLLKYAFWNKQHPIRVSFRMQSYITSQLEQCTDASGIKTKINRQIMKQFFPAVGEKLTRLILYLRTREFQYFWTPGVPTISTGLAQLIIARSTGRGLGTKLYSEVLYPPR